ncbi:neuroglobin-like [Stylophora pistillata]|uniref:neuroglobin-like n=1 Tax=Stylophora pistillata TaxID=50429 RepID=UPI000C04E0A3|nr:neuroglobin-like [Stylophora pistillata]
MGCSASSNNRIEIAVSVAAASSASRIKEIPLSHEQKNTLREFWKLVDPVKSVIGKNMFKRLFECNPRVQDIFPAFKSLKLEDVINSRSLYLHVRRVMAALENALLSLNDAEVFMEYLKNLGERHKPWSVRLEHFDMIEEALIWTLKDSFPTKCTDYIAETWRELFRFITANVMKGLRRTNTDS